MTTNGPVLLPVSDPLFRPSLIKVTANHQVLKSSTILYDTDLGGIINALGTKDSPFQKWTVEWPLQSDAIAINVYAGFSPTSLRKIVTTTPLPGTTTSVVLIPPLIFDTHQNLPYISAPQDMRPYVNVSKILADNSEVFLQSDPATEETGINDLKLGFNPIPISQDFPETESINRFHRYAYEEIRRRHIAQLAIGGEDAIVFIRRWVGTPCQCVDDDASDPDYQSRGRCVLCFGTGVFGGYYLGITIKIRYSKMPRRKIRYEAHGIVTEHPWDAWTLWEPRLHEHDILVRVKTGEKFEITNTARSEFRGLPLHQEMTLQAIQPNDVRSTVDDDHIINALNKENTFGFARFGWTLF